MPCDSYRCRITCARKDRRVSSSLTCLLACSLALLGSGENEVGTIDYQKGNGEDETQESVRSNPYNLGFCWKYFGTEILRVLALS